MNGYNFTNAVREALAQARNEASRLHHEYVATEHILLGLLVNRDNLAVAIVEGHQVSLDEVRQRVEAAVKLGSPTGRGPDLPYTSRAKKSLEEAMSEARDLGDDHVGTGHMLLGLLRERKGVAGVVLHELGINRDSSRGKMMDLRMSGRQDPDGARPPRGEMHELLASRMLEAIASAPHIAPIFAAHNIDVPRLIEDIRRVEKADGG